MRTAGQLIVDSLVLNGIDKVFCVPGESYLGLLDPLYGRADIDTVVCRHEAGAGFMALADARLSGRPGVAMVSRGPGACNASIAVHTAQQDGVPFLLLIGQVGTSDIRRDSFQEIDYGQMFGRMAKWTAEVTDPDRVAETVLRALQVATTGLPGPVVLAFSEDVLLGATSSEPVRAQAPVRSAPMEEDAARVRAWLAASERPLVIAGRGLGRPGGREALVSFVHRWRVPCAVSFRQQDLFDNADPLYAGDLGLANPTDQIDAFGRTDLLVVLGAELDDITTQGYTFPSLVRPRSRLVHVNADPRSIGTHFSADVAIGCDPVAFLNALGDAPDDLAVSRAAWIDVLTNERRRITRVREFDVGDGIPFESVVARLAGTLAADAIVTLDAGTFAAPAYRLIPFRPPQRLLAPISGAMGFGIPAAVAAALREPGRPVICLVGDGGFLMTGNELAVALERKLPLKVILSENGVYGSIRIHQERDFPGRAVGTGFVNPDFDLIGTAFGFPVTRLRTGADLDLLPDLIATPGPSFIIVETSVEAVLPKRKPPSGQGRSPS